MQDSVYHSGENERERERERERTNSLFCNICISFVGLLCKREQKRALLQKSSFAKEIDTFKEQTRISVLENV